MRRCTEQTYTWDADGPASGGATGTVFDILHIGTSDEPVGLSVFGIHLWDSALEMVPAADVQLSLVEDDDENLTRELYVVDRTTFSVDGQVQGRLVVAFPRAFPVPLSSKGSGKRMGTRLRVENIQATCRQWKAFLSVVRGEKAVFG